ncbi:MAG: hypothetical protein LBD52_07475 [Prevotellaceae bacterium]|jgi:hypothetical protein|nr:hypothetical protein [Prevotellaceae bacterium]
MNGKKIREKLGDFFVDIAKLVFGGVVLSVILDFEMNKTVVLLSGIVATAAIAYIGFKLYKGG